MYCTAVFYRTLASGASCLSIQQRLREETYYNIIVPSLALALDLAPSLAYPSNARVSVRLPRDACAQQFQYGFPYIRVYGVKIISDSYLVYRSPTYYIGLLYRTPTYYIGLLLIISESYLVYRTSTYYIRLLLIISDFYLLYRRLT